MCVTPFAGGIGGTGGDALCATLYAGGCFAVLLEALEMWEVLATRFVVLCLLEGVDGGLCLLEVLEVL